MRARHRPATVLACAFTLFVATPLAAQEILPGLRVRSWVAPPGEWHTGTLVRFGPDSLVIQPCPECATEAQPWPRVSRVEVSQGESWSGRNAAIGALVGGTLAAVIRAQKVKHDAAPCDGGPCALEGIEIPLAGLLGAAGGALLGSLFRVEAWREIYGSEHARD